MPETTISSAVEITTVLEIGQGPSGPPGTPGLPGSSQVISLTATEAIGGQRALIATGASGAAYASSADASHYSRVVGISVGAASLGAAVEVQSSGPMEELGWSWIPGQDLWLGSNGLLTQTYPAGAAFSQRLGFALSPTRIWVDISEPVLSD